MIKNNIEVDVKVKCIENKITQVQLAEDIGTTGQYVNRINYTWCNREQQKGRRYYGRYNFCSGRRYRSNRC